ncbi:hypothetical protein DN062_12630 [Nitrincola tibetensis]|uniref:Alpha/beta hydrolase n=1 Tax=Nitrincola tibetensis TaxID=2219697 RepID=A0A364NKL2_9GAMM|nr:hypothetical protein [Nitrincola tibetensis]RAU17530.1 hypothetical protein DN062_12630 [Nitrincola tibetensis]
MSHSSVQYCPKSFAVPIIFVPGLMGSRLRIKQDKRIVWEPLDNIGNAIRLARSNAVEKRAELIGLDAAPYSPDYLEVDLGESNPQHPFLQERIDRGWGGVLQGSYSGFLAWLQVSATLPENGLLPRGCSALHYEVWAPPYNWTDDNLNSGRDLGDTVRKALEGTAKKYQGTDVQVLKPIIITHSMGGLVSRAYTQLHGGAEEVHGVIHGALPCEGAPAAYKRILAGFEGAGIERHVLGANQQEVTATAANMPGVLQLLPNQWHKTVNGAKAWLHCTGKDGSKLWSKPAANPYSEIYSNQSDWWRLVYKEHLNPGSDNESEAYISYVKALKNAESFHAQLGPSAFHPNPRMFYSDDTEHSSWDSVEWKQTETEDIPPDDTFQDTNGRGIFTWSRMVLVVDFGGFEPVPRLITHYELQPANAPGDGTVHSGSGLHVSGPMSLPINPGFEHQPAFDSKEARRLTKEWLFEMVEEQL